MAKAVIMPKAGITVESCIIESWKVKVGDQVKVGDILFTYETDKTAFECESTEEGELLEIFFEDGDEVPCLVNVCAIGKKGDDVSALRPAEAGGSAAPAAEEPAPAPAEETPAEAPAPAATETAAPATEAPAPVAVPSGDVHGVSPRAKKLAERAGVDASAAAATGPNGRVIERDVRELMESGASPAAAAAAAPAATAAAVISAPADVEFEDVKFSGIRQAISKSMHQSLASMAQLTHNFSFDASAILAYRKMLKAAEGETAGITLGDMVLFAVSRTLLSCPDLNAHMLDDKTIRLFKHVHLGVAVDTPRGLMVPTIFNADQKSLLEISNEVKELAAGCRENTINPDLLRGGSFTVSNLGAAGVESFTPVINPPQTGILGVCKTVDRVRKGANGEIEIYPAMTLSMTYDHRAIDGAPLSRYVQGLCKQLENFTALLAK